MNKFKLFLAIFFLIIGLITAFLTYSFSYSSNFGKIESKTPRSLGTEITTTTFNSINLSNIGVPIGLGIISGFSFLSTVLLVKSIENFKK